MHLSSQAEISCNSECANSLSQDSADDSKRTDKQQRMIVREGGRGGIEKPEKQERRSGFQFPPRFLKNAFTCLVIGLYNVWRLPYIIQEAGRGKRTKFYRDLL